ncbi:MAG: asparaginase [Pyrinomonadaceae bacterium]
MMVHADAAPLVEIRRGSITESLHRGFLCAVDGTGRVIAAIGEPEKAITYLRSSAKPFQAIPLVASGAADRFCFSPEEIALCCGSHSGESIHIETVARMLSKIGLTPDSLKCGVHEPFSRIVTQQLRASGQKPDPRHHNCSGKHTGMLALAIHLGAQIDKYDQADNPVQIEIIQAVSLFSGTAVNDLIIATDGCGVPTFGMNIQSMALMYARLANIAVGISRDICNVGPSISNAVKRIFAAMVSHPEMVGGTHERLDTEIILTTNGKVVSKIGAEGVYAAGVNPSERWPMGLGIVLKIENGDDRRARHVAVIEALTQLGILPTSKPETLAQFDKSILKNHHGDIVGEVRSCFRINLHESSHNL